ncbi:MAG: hypothetical protein WAU21_00850 [Chitinophagales bacterium]|nr:hypothetical protein [Bacteroidota bacterium]MBK8488298.1 hypothetical protein [Bacteroidota bacterium]MBK8681916.1 hypothetical protein [Bacteroidota bacterium]
MNAQDLIVNTNILKEDVGSTGGGSGVFNHLNKIGLTSSFEEFICSPNLGERNLIYTISQQSDLVYFESYYDSTHVEIFQQGYYRLCYINWEYGYCWEKDLVWNSFDRNGSLIKKEYFEKGKTVDTPKMPQPN